MMSGEHEDRTFVNAIHAGPRKRLLFRDEVQSWLSGELPIVHREVMRMHPELCAKRKDADIKKVDHNSGNCGQTTKTKQKNISATGIFLRPPS